MRQYLQFAFIHRLTEATRSFITRSNDHEMTRKHTVISKQVRSLFMSSATTANGNHNLTGERSTPRSMKCEQNNWLHKMRVTTISDSQEIIWSNRSLVNKYLARYPIGRRTVDSDLPLSVRMYISFPCTSRWLSTKEISVQYRCFAFTTVLWRNVLTKPLSTY